MYRHHFFCVCGLRSWGHVCQVSVRFEHMPKIMRRIWIKETSKNLKFGIWGIFLAYMYMYSLWQFIQETQAHYNIPSHLFHINLIFSRIWAYTCTSLIKPLISLFSLKSPILHFWLNVISCTHNTATTVWSWTWCYHYYQHHIYFITICYHYYQHLFIYIFII